MKSRARRWKSFVFAGVFACMLPGCYGDGIRTDPGSDKLLKSADVAFALRAAQSDQGKMELGQLASDNGSSPRVKAFGQQMIEEHSKMNERLAALAAEQHLGLPATLNARDQSVYTKLRNESGPKFDRDYVKAMMKDHKNDLKQFRKEASKGKDASLRDFASAGIPMLQSHLEKIEAIQSTTLGQ